MSPLASFLTILLAINSGSAFPLHKRDSPLLIPTSGYSTTPNTYTNSAVAPCSSAATAPSSASNVLANGAGSPIIQPPASAPIVIAATHTANNRTDTDTKSNSTKDKGTEDKQPLSPEAAKVNKKIAANSTEIDDVDHNNDDAEKPKTQLLKDRDLDDLYDDDDDSSAAARRLALAGYAGLAPTTATAAATRAYLASHIDSDDLDDDDGAHRLALTSAGLTARPFLSGGDFDDDDD